MKPLIRRSDLSDPPRYYVLTRYRINGPIVVASTKYDVTDQIEVLIADATAAHRPARKTQPAARLAAQEPSR